ncbi:MAG: glycosyltransferase family 4 protein [Candidatus Woesearchaeota archaeon]|jgi:glycosyltransferase involved in cell wall biosynthesis
MNENPQKVEGVENKKKKLLIATDNFLPRWDGISRFLSVLVPNLKEEYDLTVIAPKFGPFIPNGFKLIQVPLGKIGMGDYTGAAFKTKMIKKAVKDADIVFSQTIGPIGFFGIYYAKKYRVPVASFIHSVEWELVPLATQNSLLKRLLFPAMKSYARFIYNKSNLLIVPAENIAEILTWKGINTKKRIVHLGVDSNVFKPVEDKSEAELDRISRIKDALGLGNEFVIGYHGRIANEKDLFTLLRAFNWLKRKHSDVKLLIVGDGVLSIKEKLKANSGVILPGAKNNVQDYLSLMDVYVTSSLTETTSLTTLEAMASGLPVISTPVGFIKEYLNHNYNGLIFPRSDAFALYKDLENIKHNPSLATLYGSRARKTVLKDFQWSHTIESIKEALKSIEKK